ncbi:MAG TPA: hypothetical protein VMP67_01545 [Candidatus Limnocylindria bacterium]|nr:hypothetical protein [Candidatus Limnocylindria bacterium]
MSGPGREPRSGKPAGVPGTPDRTQLMQQHAEARRRREQAPLGSEAFRAAAEEVARIEIAIAELEEPPPDRPAA